MPRCAGIKTDGLRCGAIVGVEGAMCLWHDPARQREAEAARSRGAKTANAKRGGKSVRTVSVEEAPPPPQTLEDAAEWLSWITWAVTTGRIDGRTAHEAAYALRAFLDSRRAVDRTDERVKQLQAQLDKIRTEVA